MSVETMSQRPFMPIEPQQLQQQRQQQQQPQPQMPRKSWWSRNWKWAVPVFAGTPILVCGGFIGILFAVVFSVLTNSVAYTESVAAVRADPAIVAALGTPIEEGLPSGNVQVNGGSGYADLAIPISGPLGSGTIYVEAEKRGSDWYFTTLEVVTDDEQWYDLLAGAEP